MLGERADQAQLLRQAADRQHLDVVLEHAVRLAAERAGGDDLPLPAAARAHQQHQRETELGALALARTAGAGRLQPLALDPGEPRDALVQRGQRLADAELPHRARGRAAGLVEADLAQRRRDPVPVLVARLGVDLPARRLLLLGQRVEGVVLGVDLDQPVLGGVTGERCGRPAERSGYGRCAGWTWPISPSTASSGAAHRSSTSADHRLEQRDGAAPGCRAGGPGRRHPRRARARLPARRRRRAGARPIVRPANSSAARPSAWISISTWSPSLVTLRRKRPSAVSSSRARQGDLAAGAVGGQAHDLGDRREALPLGAEFRAERDDLGRRPSLAAATGVRARSSQSAERLALPARPQHLEQRVDLVHATGGSRSISRRRCSARRHSSRASASDSLRSVIGLSPWHDWPSRPVKPWRRRPLLMIASAR